MKWEFFWTERSLNRRPRFKNWPITFTSPPPNLTAVLFKVHIFSEGHKILQNLYLRFDHYYIGQIYGGDFVAFSEYMNFGQLENLTKASDRSESMNLTFGQDLYWKNPWVLQTRFSFEGNKTNGLTIKFDIKSIRLMRFDEFFWNLTTRLETYGR